jgi:hypothetical protein
VQNAKDTFYEVLRSRLAAINPERTIVLRGVTRPGVEVVENELVSAIDMPDCFRMHWSDAAVDCEGSLPLTTVTCAIEYGTAGTALNAGMDRGRALSAMDGELLAAVNEWPHCVGKTNYSALARGGSPSAMTTNVWWSALTFGKTVVNDDRLARTATLAVMSYQEAGEL